MAALEIRLLGKFAVSYNGAPLTGLNATRAQCLLAYLLLHRDAPVARQHLAFLFWPDSAEQQARTNLRNLLYSLKQTLPESERFLQTEEQTVQWRADAPSDLDVDRFCAAVKAAGSAEALQAAVELYTGELVPECYDDLIVADRERLAEVYRDALQRLVDLLEQLGSYAEAILRAQRLVRHDPLRENVWRQIMRLHALNGDRAGVARAYRECKAVLKRELDVEPSAETEAAYQQWKRYGEPGNGGAAPLPELPPPPAPARTVDTPAGRMPFEHEPEPRAGLTSRWQTPWSGPRGRQPLRGLNLASRLVALSVLALIAAALVYVLIDGRRAQPPAAAAAPTPAGPLVVRGCMGGSKAGLMNDPDVQRILAERYNLVVKFDAMGSRDMVALCTTGYDFVWPGTEADVERFKQKLGPNLRYTTPLNSALVFYSWSEITDALQQQGIVEEKDGVYYVADTPKLVKMVSEDVKFAEIGLPKIFGNVRIVPTNPAKSESGGIFAVYLATMFLDGHVPTSDTAGQVLEGVQDYFEKLGLLLDSTGQLFDDFLRAGPGGKPIIVAYESQGLETVAQNAQKAQILDKTRIIYPVPTVWVSHPLIALTDGGKQLTAALEDKEIQDIAWKKHGFRSGIAGITNKPEDVLPAKVPATIDSIVPLPRPEVIDLVVDALE